MQQSRQGSEKGLDLGNQSQRPLWTKPIGFTIIWYPLPTTVHLLLTTFGNHSLFQPNRFNSIQSNSVQSISKCP